MFLGGGGRFLSLRLALPRMLFAFVFGLVQGAFLFVNIPLMIVSDSLVIGLGVIVAGVVILAMPDTGSYAAISDRMHRVALLLFGFGLVGLIMIRNSGLGSVALLLFEMLILAGFNLVDFGGLVTSCVMREHIGTDAVTYLDSGRVLAYAGLALGILGGCVAMNYVQAPVDHVLVILCCVGLMILMVAVLFPSETLKLEEARCALAEEGKCSGASVPACAAEASALALRTEVQVSEEAAGVSAAASDKEGAEHPVTWEDVRDHIADTYGLSARERDVFALIAKGRNAEFVQNELFISVHTAKTHISHIYKKLGIHSMQELISLIERYQEELSR